MGLKSARLADVVTRSFSNINIIGHPLAQQKLTFMRDRECSRTRFRQITREMGAVLAYEAMRGRMAVKAAVDTPLTEPEEPFKGAALLAEKVVIVPVLRSGLVLGEGAVDMAPSARIGHIGLHRNPDNYMDLIEYMFVVPTSGNRYFIVMDLAIGTGATACKAIELMLEHGVAAHQMCFASVVASLEGLKSLESRHPNVQVFTIAVDDELNAQHHIVPGLGDTAERLFGI